jgi:multicomponent Na+:H+ antiporter subunit C
MLLWSHLPYIIAVWLCLIGLYGIVTSRNLIHMVICLTILQAATYVLIISIGFRFAASAPIYNEIPAGTRATDPVSQALILTDLVVGATVTALVLCIAVQIHKHRGTLDPNDLHSLRG